MSKQELHSRKIEPILGTFHRPLWSVMIPTYNCANYLGETLASILEQAPKTELMQIEVVDDCSLEDDPEVVVKEVGKGRVSFYRQQQNVGHVRNFNTCIQRSKGQLVHILHGDDLVQNGFYDRIQQLFERYAEIGAAYCRHIIVDEFGNWQQYSPLEQLESGILDNWLEKFASTNPLQPPSIVVRRSVYEQLGGFDSRISCCGEDWEMWLRIAAHYPIAYEVKPLAVYRSHSMSITGQCRRTGQNMRDLRKIVEISRSYLSPATYEFLSTQAKENWALWSIKWIVPEMLLKGNIKIAFIQVQEVLKCSHSRKVLKELLVGLGKVQKSYFKIVLRKMTQSMFSQM